MRRIHFVDHNITLVALAYVGGITTIEDITTVRPTDCAEFECLRRVVTEVLAGEAALGYSDSALRDLKHNLAEGGRDFEAIDEDSARETTAVLKTLSVASGGFVEDEAVQNVRSVSDRATRDFHGASDEKGKICSEDRRFIAAAWASATNGTQVSLLSNDQGINNCARALSYRNVGVVTLGSMIERRIVRVA